MQRLFVRESLNYFLPLIDNPYHIICDTVIKGMRRSTCFKGKKLTNNVGAPDADNQNVMTAAPDFSLKKW